MSRRWIELTVLGGASIAVLWDGARKVAAARGNPDIWQDSGYVALLGVLLLSLSLVNWFQTRPAPLSAPSEQPAGGNARRVAIAFAILAGYILLIKPLGYLLSTALFGVIFLRVFSSRGWAKVLIGSVAAAASISYLWRMTGMMLPQGIIPWP